MKNFEPANFASFDFVQFWIQLKNGFQRKSNLSEHDFKEYKAYHKLKMTTNNNAMLCWLSQWSTKKLVRLPMKEEVWAAFFSFHLLHLLSSVAT